MHCIQKAFCFMSKSGNSIYRSMCFRVPGFKCSKCVHLCSPVPGGTLVSSDNFDLGQP
jgi:hypothetical protein